MILIYLAFYPNYFAIVMELDFKSNSTWKKYLVFADGHSKFVIYIVNMLLTTSIGQLIDYQGTYYINVVNIYARR
jgi:hypothetical protein